MNKEFITNDGKHIVTRLSRWITIRQAYNVNRRNSLFEFVSDENGYKPGQDEFNPANGTFLDYFRFDGRTYAIEQFIALGSVWCAGAPYEFTDTDGKITFISAVDYYGDLYDPLYIELDKYGEHVRVYTVKDARR